MKKRVIAVFRFYDNDDYSRSLIPIRCYDTEGNCVREYVAEFTEVDDEYWRWDIYGNPYLTPLHTEVISIASGWDLNSYSEYLSKALAAIGEFEIIKVNLFL